MSVLTEHWLVLEEADGEALVKGCHCGGVEDQGYGDETVAHIVNLGKAEVFDRLALEFAAGSRARKGYQRRARFMREGRG